MPSGFTVTPITVAAKVPLPSTTLYVDVCVKITRQYRIRLWLGMTLIRLAAWVLGCNVEFEGDEE